MFNRTNLEDEIYAVLIDRILNGEYVDGQKIMINDIAEGLGVSRTPVISALKKLSGDGLIETSRSTGFYMPKFSDQDIREMGEAVHMVDVHASERLMGNTPEGFIEKLEDIARQAQDAAENGTLQDYLAVDLLFHTTYVSAFGSRRIYEFYEKMFQQITLARHLSQGTKEMQFREFQPQEHFRICHCVRTKDYETLIDVFGRHTDLTMSIIMGR